jgi:hypothetical protein
MPFKDQFGQKLTRDAIYYQIELFKGLKIFVSIGNLVYSPTHRYGESFFDEYLREFEAKIGTARNVVQGT